MSLMYERLVLREVSLVGDPDRHIPSSRDDQGRIRCPYCEDRTLGNTKGLPSFFWHCQGCNSLFGYGAKYSTTDRMNRASLVRSWQAQAKERFEVRKKSTGEE